MLLYRLHEAGHNVVFTSDYYKSMSPSSAHAQYAHTNISNIGIAISGQAPWSKQQLERGKWVQLFRPFLALMLWLHGGIGALDSIVEDGAQADVLFDRLMRKKWHLIIVDRHASVTGMLAAWRLLRCS